MTEKEMIDHEIQKMFGSANKTKRNDLIFMFVIGFLSGLAVFGLVLGVLYGM